MLRNRELETEVVPVPEGKDFGLVVHGANQDATRTWGRVQQSAREEAQRAAHDDAACSPFDRLSRKRSGRQRSTVLEQFEGFVEQIDDDIAHVTLTSQCGDTLYGEYPARDLLALGIRERRRFRCVTVDEEGKVRVELTAIPDQDVSAAEEDAIRRELEERLGNDE